MIGAILLAAGSGSRMQGEIEDKLLHPIGSSNAFSLCCRSFLQAQRDRLPRHYIQDGYSTPETPGFMG